MIAAAAYPKFLTKHFAAMDFSAEASLPSSISLRLVRFSKTRAQISLSWVRSSMFMSLNSLDSKISPHSLHSTNSQSSSRLTICTRGCLQGCLACLRSEKRRAT